MPLDHQPYFQHEPLDASSRRCFRLCKILPGSGDSPVLCELTNEAITAQSGRYEALSYTWGTDKQQRWIKLNGKPYWVRPNLLLALRTIRKSDEALVVWVDAICINQSDGAEQVHQVSVMGDIYRNAKQVLAWIGPAADNSDALFDYLENLDSLKGVDEEKDDDDDDDDPEKALKMAVVKTALRHLNNRPYWRRAWIKQELIHSRNITVYCGSRKSHDMETFFRFGSVHQLSGQVEGYEDYMLKVYLHRSERREGKCETLKELMDRYSNTECARVRDRVFALYSLAADCQDLGHITPIIDYDISIPALFFALLAHFRPSDVLGFAATLQNVLNVRAVRLQEYWDKASIREIRGNKPAVVSAAEGLAMDYIRQIKAYSSALSCGSDKTIPSTPDFIVRSHMAKFAPEELGKQDVNVRIDGSKFSLRMKHTLLGLRLLSIYEGDKEFTRSLTEQEASKFMHLVSIVLSDKGKHFYGQEAIERVSGFTENQGAGAARPGIEIICSGLAEMSRREDKFTMCLVDCRFLLNAIHGYSLLRPGHE